MFFNLSWVPSHLSTVIFPRLVWRYLTHDNTLLLVIFRNWEETGTPKCSLWYLVLRVVRSYEVVITVFKVYDLANFVNCLELWTGILYSYCIKILRQETTFLTVTACSPREFTHSHVVCTHPGARLAHCLSNSFVFTTVFICFWRLSLCLHLSWDASKFEQRFIWPQLSVLGF